MNQFYLYFCTLIIFSYGTNPCLGQSLRSLAEKHHRYIGLMASPSHLPGETEFTIIADREFDMLTPGNDMKWDVTEPTRGQFNFKNADTLVSHAQAHSLKVRGHTLVWHSQLAHWVETGHFSAADLHSIMLHHIAGVAGHYKGKIYAWDVVNEVLEWDGSFRKSIFYNTLGKSFIADAFKAAHEADPAAKLYINDYGVEGVNSKSTALYNLAKELKAAGVPIHGVGLQAHLTTGSVPHDLEQNMKRFSDLGLDVALTEVDLKIHKPVDAAKLEQQAKDYATLFQACLAVSRCVGITIEGVTDKYAWVGDTGATYGSPLLFDEHYKEKPAYAAVKRVLA